MMGIMDFNAVDADADGKITMAEIEAHRAAMFARADTNGDARLSADELAAHRLAMMTAWLKEGAADMLKEHDADGDGALSAAEMPKPPRADKFFARADTDGDGALSMAEVAVVRAKMKERHGRHRANDDNE